MAKTTTAPSGLLNEEFDYGGGRFCVVQQVGHDLTICARIDHGTGRGQLVDFDTNFVLQVIEEMTSEALAD